MSQCEAAESSSQVNPQVIDGKKPSPLDEVLRQGARQMLVKTVEAEVAAYIETHQHEVDENGRRLVVRNGHAPGIVQSNQVVPVSGEPLGAAALLPTEYVHGRGLFPKRALGHHDGRVGRGKCKIRHEGRRIAFDRSLFARIAGRARAEFHHHFRPDETVVIEQWCIADVNPVPFSASPSGKTGPPQTRFDHRQSLFPGPIPPSVPGWPASNAVPGYAWREARPCCQPRSRGRRRGYRR